MIKTVITILMGDHLCFLILAIILANKTAPLPRLNWLLGVLFPWFALLHIPIGPLRRLYRTKRSLYNAGFLLLTTTGLSLLLIDAAQSVPEISSCGALICLWTWIEDLLVRPFRDRGDSDRDDDDPIGPTPTGDAADAWLHSLHRQEV
jgi:hypothetical protein